MAVDELQGAVHPMLFGREAVVIEGLSERGQRVYRRQVRRSLINGVTLALPITRRLLGEDAVVGLIVAWLDQSPPTTRLYWQLPLEFAAWLAAQPSPAHPALPELVHWETVEVDILNSPNGSSAGLVGAPGEGDGAVLDPSARLCIYHHPVHRMTQEASSWPEALATPVFLAVYRVNERVRWTVLDPRVAQLLAQLSEGATVGEGLTFLEELYGEVDRPWMMEQLRSLVERGVLLGFGAAE